ncbi:DUF1351 domain-containing protein [Nitratidesulfovibrio sp. HK-II]|uniref:DUF1351 domain-containing protein n=1 Tax=Nitratidesulfovibrio sp. HK-II TaxID=2009266 RepID=UPI000E2EF707|nr:DUF1351 domain-containing protein [Nitratidesulfovibrio sp. HK-II]GBO96909.1 hypothetical protein RVX_1948 [Nitratidesulfovibrio sp. HK-II]GBO98209.1 hypothetical protein RVX_3248 [Nitratidesulfovibrio sp. HK-II]
MTEPKITETLPAISFNAEELEAWVRAIVANYEGLVVTEDMVPAIKSEMAGLNKVRDRLEAARKEAVRRVSAPIREFEDRIKAVTAIIVEARAGLDAQVKAFEELQRADKRREVQFLITATLDEHGLPGLDIPIQDAWLNKTKPLKTVKAEVEAIILRHIQQERERAALEQAQQDRAVAIEQKVEALAEIYGFSLPASSFLRLQDLQVPLAEALTQIEQAYSARAQAMRIAPAAPAATPPRSAQVLQPVAPTAAPGRPLRKTLTITLEYDAMREPAVLASLRHLESLCASFTRTPGMRAA